MQPSFSTAWAERIINWQNERKKRQKKRAHTKILKVEELAPQSVIENNEAWKTTVEETKVVPVALNGPTR